MTILVLSSQVDLTNILSCLQRPNSSDNGLPRGPEATSSKRGMAFFCFTVAIKTKVSQKANLQCGAKSVLAVVLTVKRNTF